MAKSNTFFKCFNIAFINASRDPFAKNLITAQMIPRIDFGKLPYATTVVPCVQHQKLMTEWTHTNTSLKSNLISFNDQLGSFSFKILYFRPTFQAFFWLFLLAFIPPTPQFLKIFHKPEFLSREDWYLFFFLTKKCKRAWAHIHMYVILAYFQKMLI